MAMKTATNYYSNAIVGVPQAGADINVHEVNSNPKYFVGFGFERADGSNFRYVQYGSDTNAGLLVTSQLGTNSVTVTGTNVVIQSDSATAVANERYLPGKIGSHYQQLKLSAGTNVFAGGYLHVCGGRGAGYTYRIRGNTATGSPSETNLRLTLYEPIAVEIGTESNIAITGNPWANVIPSFGDTNTNFCGVSMSSAGNNTYGWIATCGIVTCLTGATNLPTLNSTLVSDSGTGGAISEIEYVTTMNTATSVATTVSVGKPVIGTCIHTGSNGTHSAIALNLSW